MPSLREKLSPTALEIGWDGGLVCAADVKDVKASVAWYENVLGFQKEYFLEDMGWAEVASPVAGVSVGLSQVESPNPGNLTLTFGVKDIVKAKAAIEARGGQFDGDVREIPGMVKLAMFKDPDGNSLMLYQSLAPA